jgi:hypothetical protein
MARDYEDFSRIDDLDDDELRELVRQRLGDHPNLDLDDFVVHVEDGTIRLEGRVGTEGELRIADHVLTDLVGVGSFDNQLMVDANRRVETPMDVEEHLAADGASAGSVFGEMPEQESSEVFQARGDEDLDQRMFGTTNYQDAVAHGVPYEPPEAPTQEGIRGTDAGPGEYGEDH